MATGLVDVSTMALVPLAMAACLAPIVRFRRSSGVERQQIKVARACCGRLRLVPGLGVPGHHLTDVDGKDPAIRARRIDMRMSDPLTHLPPHVFGDDPAVPRSLILRNLQRGVTVGLPSGQDVARAMCLAPLTADTFAQAATFGLDHAGWHGHWPLWAYILAEATQHHDGTRLGPVGGRIVAEVIIGLIANDDHSYLAVDPCWAPADNARTLTDVLALAGEL